MATIRPADFSDGSSDLDICRTLMREYAAFLNASVGGEHICVESLEAELAALPGSYAEPRGAVLLAFADDEPAGCVALKPLHVPPEVLHALKNPSSERACEMKRLWVRPGQQGSGLGRRLAEAIIEAAREREYSAMYLDTMPASMHAAYALYRSMGFEPVERYTENPVLLQTGSLTIAFLRKDLP